MREDVAKLIEAYGDALGRGPGAIAELFAEPCVTARAGVARVHATRTDVEAFFAEVEDTYRARGFTHGDVLSLHVEPLGSNSALATVQWAYRGACEELLWKSTFSYNLYRLDGRWTILVQTMHDS